MKIAIALVLGFIAGVLAGDQIATARETAKAEAGFAEKFCFQAVRTGALKRCGW